MALDSEKNKKIVMQVGNLTETKRDNCNRRRVYLPQGMSPTLTSGMGMGGNLQPFILTKMQN